MLADVVPYLRCPVCASGFALDGAAIRCASGHSYDVARQGYVNLLTSKGAGTADNAGMVAARAAFLGAGHYEAIMRTVASEVDPSCGLVVDVGAGTGEYLAAALESAPAAVGLAIDVSVPAVRRAAKVPRVGAAVADVWQSLPLRDGVADVVLNIFAPRNAAEFRRIVRDDGHLVVVTPAEDHLAELTSALGLLTVDPHKAERLSATLEGYFAAKGRWTVTGQLTLTHADVHALVAMGPSAHHVADTDLAARIAELPDPYSASFGVRVSSYWPI
jgi:23S rRNA (guanine745-N1)-methyltransferase